MPTEKGEKREMREMRQQLQNPSALPAVIDIYVINRPLSALFTHEAHLDLGLGDRQVQLILTFVFTQVSLLPWVNSR